MSEVVNVVVAFAVIVFIVRWATRNSKRTLPRSTKNLLQYFSLGGSSDEAIRARNVLGFRPKTVTDQMVMILQCVKIVK